MFEQMKSAAIAVMVAGALALAATPVVTFEASAADAAKPAAAKKSEDCGKQFKKGTKEYKQCMAPAKKGAKKMEKPAK